MNNRKLIDLEIDEFKKLLEKKAILPKLKDYCKMDVKAPLIQFIYFITYKEINNSKNKTKKKKNII